MNWIKRATVNSNTLSLVHLVGQTSRLSAFALVQQVDRNGCLIKDKSYAPQGAISAMAFRRNASSIAAFLIIISAVVALAQQPGRTLAKL